MDEIGAPPSTAHSSTPNQIHRRRIKHVEISERHPTRPPSRKRVFPISAAHLLPKSDVSDLPHSGKAEFGASRGRDDRAVSARSLHEAKRNAGTSGPAGPWRSWGLRCRFSYPSLSSVECGARSASGGARSRDAGDVWAFAKKEMRSGSEAPTRPPSRNRMFPISATHLLPKSGKPDFGGRSSSPASRGRDDLADCS
jgi:hypothetical protein